MNPHDTERAIKVLTEKMKTCSSMKRIKYRALLNMNVGELQRAKAVSELFYIECFEKNGEMVARRDGKKCTGKLTAKSTPGDIYAEAERLTEFEYKIGRYANV